MTYKWTVRCVNTVAPFDVMHRVVEAPTIQQAFLVSDDLKDGYLAHGARYFDGKDLLKTLPPAEINDEIYNPRGFAKSSTATV